ncbi:hypothetical protein EG328_011998 [Venturia inaequalis]|uniref:Uncharacterized protein n=1 Tax=Venturia inaequalis TaxID=5025 RepID=A0A8H3Z507_VENIN|nr:hypothetical protein EG328_011998 [Venturia inaequalis]
MDSPHLTKTNQRLSMRQQLKSMVKGSNWTGLVKHKSDASRLTAGSPTKSQVAELPAGYDFLTNGIPSTNRKPARERPRRRQERQKTVRLDNQRNSLYTLQIEEPNLDDLRKSFEQGDDRWSVANPATLQRELQKELAVGRGPAEKEVVNADPLQLPDHTETHIGSEASVAPSRVDSTRPDNDTVPELRKPTRKWEVKTDNLARPVSSATGNTEALKVSKTIESINKNRYSMPVMKEREHIAAATSYQNMARRGSEMAPEVVSPLIEEMPVPAVVASNNTKEKRTIGIAGVDKPVIETKAATPPVLQSNTPIAESMRSPSTFTFNINDNLRRAAPGATSTLNPNSNRHSVGDTNKLLEEDRESRSPIRKQPPTLNIKRSFSQGATSPTKKAGTQPNTPTYRPRRVSGAKMADRMAWIRELEEKSSGKGSPGRAAMYKNLQGGVADKLARFESSNKESGPNLTRANSHSSRMSTFNDAYGIENATGKRLSKASTMDDEFRRKLEEVAQNTKKKIEKEGDQEALIAQVNRDAELALKEEKRRSLKMESAGPFKYAYNEKAGRKTDLVPDPTKITTVATTPPADEVNLQSFTPTRRGSTKMPKFHVKDPNAVSASAAALAEKKIATPVFGLKDPSAVAAAVNPPVAMDPQGDDYDPFNVMTYPVSKAMPAIRKLTAAETKERHLSMEALDSQPVGEAAEEPVVPEPAVVDAPQVSEEPKGDMAEQPATQSPAVESEEIMQPQPTQESKTETATEQEPQSDQDKTAPAIETTGITTNETKDDTRAEASADPAAAVQEKEASQLVEQTKPEAHEETKMDETTQPTPKIEAKTSSLPMEPIALELPRVAEDTKPEASPELATIQAPSPNESTAAQEDETKAEKPVEPTTTQSPPPEQSTTMQKATTPDTANELATNSPPADKVTTAEVPVINTTPPTPPAKKEQPIPKYIALRERAQKAAEMTGKAAPGASAPVVVAPSQTFSRLFGPPMSSGMGRSRSSSPVKGVVRSDGVVKKGAEVPTKKESNVKEELPAKATTPSTEKPSGKETSTQQAKEEIPKPKKNPVVVSNNASPNGTGSETESTNTPIAQDTSTEKELVKEPTPLEKAKPAEVADGEKVWPIDESAPVPVEDEKTASIAKESSMSARKVTPFPTSMSMSGGKDGLVKREEVIREE